MRSQRVAPIVAGALLLAAWEAGVSVLAGDSFVLPPPSRIAVAFVDNAAAVRSALATTGSVVLVGGAAGTLLGVAAALAVTRFRAVSESLTPLAVTVNAVPIVALAPIFNAWFGITSPLSHQAVVTVVTFFPVFINTVRGLTDVDPAHIDVMRSLAAGEWRIARHVRFPNALPFLFAALKIVASLAVIAAIVAEYFGGRQDALGPLIVQSAGLSRYDDAWAAVTAGAALGIALYAIAAVLERIVVPWRPAAE